VRLLRWLPVGEFNHFGDELDEQFDPWESNRGRHDRRRRFQYLLVVVVLWHPRSRSRSRERAIFRFIDDIVVAKVGKDCQQRAQEIESHVWIRDGNVSRKPAHSRSVEQRKPVGRPDLVRQLSHEWDAGCRRKRECHFAKLVGSRPVRVQVNLAEDRAHLVRPDFSRL